MLDEGPIPSQAFLLKDDRNRKSKENDKNSKNKSGNKQGISR